MCKRLGIAAVLVALTVGCTTQEGYEQTVNAYVGSSEATLLANWGPPDQVYASDADTKYLTYARSRSGYVPGTSPSYQTSCSFGICTAVPVGGSAGFSYSKSCRTSFKLVHGTVASWRFQGNDCRA